MKENTIEKLNTNDCCGCSACYQRCPKNAITMVENDEGFLFPKIDKNKCVNCGLCVKSCPQLNKIAEKKENFPKAYAVYNKNDNELLESSSGGVFSVVANYVLEKNGVIIGAAYDEDNNVKHICVENKKDLNRLRGSKYVQSDINQTYKIAEENLKQGKIVLFTGTPCQVAGIKSFLGKDYDNLILADIVCHGVPNQKLFKKYLNWLGKKYNSEVSSYSFRNKEKRGWGLTAKVVFNNGKTKYIPSDNDPYYNNFLECKTYRKSCYQCHYTAFTRESDITLADYWGILSVHPEFYSEKGVSLILVNSEKGKKIFEKISSKINYIETDIEKAARKNINLKRPSDKPKIRENIYNGIQDKDDITFINDNLKIEFNLKKKIKSMVPYQVKLMIKNIRRKK